MSKLTKEQQETWDIMHSNMRVGDTVAPPDPRHHLSSGAEYYPYAVVCSVDPFVIISYDGTMRWNCEKAEDYETIGRTKNSIFKICMKRFRKNT